MKSSTVGPMLAAFPYLPSALRWRLGGKLLAQVRLHGPELGQRVCTCKDGFRLQVDLEDWLGSHVAVWGEYEPGLSSILRQRLKPGDHFLDVGANIGYFTLLARTIVGSSGRVTSAEASARTYEKLQANVSLNGFDDSDRVSLRACAAWSENTTLSFNQAHSSRSGVSSVRPLDNCVETYEVKAGPIDDLVDWNTHAVAAVKIDVEGAEYEALKGMSQLVAHCKPMIAIELSESYLRQLNSSPREVVSLLSERWGYDLYDYDHLGVLRRRDADEIVSEAASEQLNILCLAGSSG